MKKFLFVVQIYSVTGDKASRVERCMYANSFEEAQDLFSSTFDLKHCKYKILRVYVEIWRDENV